MPLKRMSDAVFLHDDVAFPSFDIPHVFTYHLFMPLHSSSSCVFSTIRELRVRTDLGITIPESLNKILTREKDTIAVGRKETGPDSIGCYGAAVDLGSSHIRVSLWDMAAGKLLAARSKVNPQIALGADVLTRLSAASRSPAQAHELSVLSRHAIDEALHELLLGEALKLRDVGRIVLVGNTAMLALLAEKNFELLLKPVNWMREIDCCPEDARRWFSEWGLNEKADITIIPPLAGFVGSDLLAGILATRLIEGPDAALLIDFGVNSEIALWDGTTLWATSAAGGPAFEGSGISCGMPADPGAIFRVTLDQPHAGFRFEVIGGIEPTGICGTGLVDLISCFLTMGALASNGRLKPESAGREAGMLQGPGNLTLGAGDIDSLQRAKAAVAAGALYLLAKAGMSMQDLRKIRICGAFGKYLDVRNAQRIGLIPLIPEQDVELCGNTALAGCELMLFNHDCEETISLIRNKTRIVNLSQARGFEELFIESLPFRPMPME